MFEKLWDKMFVRPDTRPPVNTPDLCLLQQKPVHLIFDWRNVVKSHALVDEAYTTRKFVMWKQNHVDQTPPLVFNRQIHPLRVMERAKVRGKVHTISVDDIVSLDKQIDNGVSWIRRPVPITLAELTDRTNKLDEEQPVRVSAWMYVSNFDWWRPQFDFDYDLWRGRKDSMFLPAEVKDHAQKHIARYFLPVAGPAHKVRPTFAFFDMGKYKRELKLEENAFKFEMKELEKEKKNEQPISPERKVS